MKKATLEATDENVLQSIADKIGNRNECILEFIKTLDSIDGNRFISLNAKWGEGKTFYVRQIEKTLEYQTLRKFNPEDTKYKEMTKYFQNTVVEKIELEHSYFPVYYNAWLYDNHTDPLISLLYIVTKECSRYVDTIRRKKVSECFGILLSAFSMSIQCKNIFQMSVDSERISKLFKNKDILEEIKNIEEIREKVKEVFDSVIVENTQKLVIFIDELDRCKPSYALEMLERIKHYFDDDRIIFIVSVNKEQLTHTISNYYGNGFDSTSYLNKFFDLEAHFPELQTYDTEIYTNNTGQYFLNSISNMLVKYYRLSRRDFLIYREKINNLGSCKEFNDYSFEGSCLSLFVPILIIFDMKNMTAKENFLNGESKMLEIIKMLPEGKYLYERFASPGCEQSEKLENGYIKFKMVYDFTFGNLDEEKLLTMKIGVSRDLKQKILRYCGQI